jgi:transposase
MMGTKERAFAPVVAVSLEALVPPDHFYRHLDRALDLSFVRELVQDTYAARGRPSIDPVVFFRLQLVMFFEGIRSERLLMRLVADKLSVRWFLGYDLNEALPDHSSLTRIRTRYGLRVFHRFFEAIVEQCRQAKLIWGKELYIDATKVNANADLDSLMPRFAVEAREAFQAHLAALFAEETQDGKEQAVPAPAQDTPEAPPNEEASACALPSSPPSLPVTLPAPLYEALAQEHAARHDWIAEEGRPDREIRGYYQRTSDLRISTTDPDATPMRLKGGGTHLGYQVHYVIDGGKRRIIVGVLVTPGEVIENQPMLDLVFRARFRWGLHPRQVTGDTKYGTLENIVALETAGIRAYMPLPNWEEQHEVWSASHFRYESEANQYRCPEGTILKRVGEVNATTGRQLYRAPALVCNSCPVKAQCTTSTLGRTVYRHVGEEYLERVRAYQETPAYQKALRKRQVWVEPLFAEAKDWHGMRRFRLRRLWRVNCEALLIASGQNIKRLLSRRGWGRRPLPSGAAIHWGVLWLGAWCLRVQATLTVIQDHALSATARARLASYHSSVAAEVFQHAGIAFATSANAILRT